MMVVQVYMKSECKKNYSSGLFMDYESGLIDVVSDVHSIEDADTNYIMFDKNRNNLKTSRKDRYYYVIKNE